MHGMKIFPDYLIEQFGGRTKGEYVGSVKLTPPVDIATRELAEQTVAMGRQMIDFWSDANVEKEAVSIPIETDMATLPLELFDPNDFVQYWNPDWSLHRAGYGTPGGGFRGIRGGTFYITGFR